MHTYTLTTTLQLLNLVIKNTTLNMSTTTGKRTMEKSTGARKKKKAKEVAVADEMRKYEMDVMDDLQSIVDTLTRQVNEDWHNGWDKQAEITGEWFMELRLPLQKILDIGIEEKSCLKQCNELLKILSCSWKDLNEVGCRVDVKTMLGESCDSLSFELELPWSEPDQPMEIRTTSFARRMGDLFAYFWNALLRTHASLEGTDEGLLLQCIKDASDNNGDNIKFDGPLCDPWEGEDEDEPDAPDGKDLARIIKEKESEWKALPKTYTR